MFFSWIGSCSFRTTTQSTRYFSLPAVTTTTVRLQGPPGSHRIRAIWTTPSDSAQKTYLLGSIFLDNKDGLLAPRRRRLACSAKASRRLWSPTPPVLPRSLSHPGLPQDGLDALPKRQDCRAPQHLRTFPGLFLTCTHPCLQLILVCPEHCFFVRIGCGFDKLLCRRKIPIYFIERPEYLHSEPGRPSKTPPCPTSAGD